MGVVCGLYLAGILVAVPLYMKEGYWQIGDGKYELFRNLSIICSGCWLAALLTGVFGEREWRRKVQWSWMDGFMLCYGLANIISFWGSAYRETAWTGCVQWYMGLLSQLLFVWIYFLVSRCCDGKLWILWLAQAGLAVVTAVGLMNRLGIDPLGVFQGLDVGGWDYTHLLSTVGNINWLSGYLSIGLSFAISGYFRGKGKAAALVQLCICGAGVVLLVIQGSDSGLAVAGALGICACVAAGMSLSLFRKVMGLGIVTCLGFILMNWGMDRQMSWDRLPQDDKGRFVMCWDGWWIVLLLLAVGLCISFWAEREREPLPSPDVVPCKADMIWKDRKDVFRVLKIIMYGTASLLLLGMILACGLLSARMREQGYGWGNGRGGLWALAVRAFREGSLWQKLAGAGPDCFGPYVYEHLPVNDYLVQTGRWENAYFVNAHNEWLNLLVNVGVMGLICFLGIFVTALIRYGRRIYRQPFFWLGVLAITGYGIHSLVSFQQVLSTPFLFAALGLCENHCRREKSFDT